MTWCHYRLILAALMLWGATRAGGADQCAACGERNVEMFFWLTNAALPTRQPVCPACLQLPTRCFICQLPVKQGGLKLDDGRCLCTLHARDAVLTLTDARAVFTEAKREMMRLLRGCGQAPDRNLTLALVPNAADLQKLAQAAGVGRAPAAPAGITYTIRPDGEFQHTVFLLSGQPRARLMAVSAHEYAHAWLNENVPPERRLDATNVEGFCELAAYRVMSDLKEETEKNVILQNPYTGEALLTFVKAEESYGFYRVVQWVQAGLEPRLDPNHLASILTLKREEVQLPVWAPAVRTTVPDTLRLKGVAGRAGHYLALINDQTLGPGETGRVRVGQTNVMVRCVSVTDKSAVIELLQGGDRQELTLDSK